MNEMNYQKKIETTSTKRIRKDLIIKYKILNDAKYFSPGKIQNYLVFISANKYFKYFIGTTEIYLWRSNGIAEKVLKI